MSDGRNYIIPLRDKDLIGDDCIRSEEIGDALNCLNGQKNIVLFTLPQIGLSTFLDRMYDTLTEQGIGARVVSASKGRGLADQTKYMHEWMTEFAKSTLAKNFEKHIDNLAGILGDSGPDSIRPLIDAISNETVPLTKALTDLDHVLVQKNKLLVILVDDFQKIPPAEYEGKFGPWRFLHDWHYENIRFVIGFRLKSDKGRDYGKKELEKLLKSDSWEEVGLKPFTKEQTRELFKFIDEELNKKPIAFLTEKKWPFFEKHDKDLRNELADFMWEEGKGCPAMIWEMFTGLRLAALQEVCPSGILETINKDNIPEVKSMLKSRQKGNAMIEHLLKMYPNV